MAKSKTQKIQLADMWEKLDELIIAYGEASRADEMKGGGDPLDVNEIESNLTVAQLRVSIQIAKIQREIK
jgi:hypothetical protein